MKSEIYAQAPAVYPSLISTIDEDGSYTLSTITPILIYGLHVTVELEIHAKTTRNMIRTGECVLNLPSEKDAVAVGRLAGLVGADSERGAALGLERGYINTEFKSTRFLPAPSEVVSVPRAENCPVQLEGRVTGRRILNRQGSVWGHHTLTQEVRILRVYLDPSIGLHDALDGNGPNRWRPLMTRLREAYAGGE
jgi:flavin reductase (DIM6/NTAB) family NADH-FMN oxidoreductase RutF